MSRQNKEAKNGKLRFVIIDDESHKQLWVRRLTRGRLAVVATSAVIIILVAIFCLIAFTPIRAFIPGYPDAGTRHEAFRNAMKIDSLENAVARWEFYSENLLRVVEGRDPIGPDSLFQTVSDSSITRGDVSVMLKKDSLLRASIADEEQFAVSGKERSLTIEGMQFFQPLKGVVARPYDPVFHPYADLTAPAGSVVMAALDGSVMDCHWDEEFGYVTMIQHDNDIVTVYEHNQKNLKNKGDRVTAGTPIAIMGDHLHFEIWYKGVPVDPAKYINF